MARPSNDAVGKATGRGWDDWFALLDEAGAAELDHKGIVRLLADEGVASGWWQQSITVAYEQHAGLRVLGQTAEGTFQVGARRTVAIEPERAWALLVDELVPRWLGAPVLPDGVGESVELADGGWVELRSRDDGSRLRLRLVEADAARTTFQVYLGDTGDGRSAVTLHHEGLASADERERMRERWRAALDELQAAAGSPA